MHSSAHKPHKANQAAWEAMRWLRRSKRRVGLEHFRLIRRLGSKDIGNVYICQIRNPMTSLENASASHLLARSLEDPQVAISDALSNGLQITSDISSEGNVKKRKDLDTPLEPQLAKRHMGHDGTDVQYITERGRTARRTVSTTRSPTVCFDSTTVMALENNGETAFSEKSTEKQQRR
ncbi:hypothetical protein PS2_021165 [Malus domestica]